MTNEFNNLFMLMLVNTILCMQVATMLHGKGGQNGVMVWCNIKN